ncbi:MAG TPA: type VI secretion system accessory protein TagJ [Polyangiaceae bacterium]|nr:type VI secretion system accessory protein TagJ [Polyangiaceae bacterium]
MKSELTLRDRPLAETLAALQQQVRAQPADARLRIFLFQLLAVLGQWDRALNQLNVSGELDASATAMVQSYRELLRCEALRAEVFTGARTPLVFGEPEPWVALLVESLKHVAAGRSTAAAALRAQAFEQAPAVGGRRWPHGSPEEGPGSDGEPFEWVADADARLGPMLEMVVNGRYWWVPFSRIRRLDVEAPTDLRDLVWSPAHAEWTNGGEVVGFVPTRYPGSEASEDDALRLASRTDWRDLGDETWAGLGQRLLATDGGEIGLLELGRIELAAADGEGGRG